MPYDHGPVLQFKERNTSSRDFTPWQYGHGNPPQDDYGWFSKACAACLKCMRLASSSRDGGGMDVLTRGGLQVRP